jgi:hypothetical protein
VPARHAREPRLAVLRRGDHPVPGEPVRELREQRVGRVDLAVRVEVLERGRVESRELERAGLDAGVEAVLAGEELELGGQPT